ncbi:MAG: leucine-rich repeat protein [Clostridia bacterium]|nr:leucine-rich repeat protein [Clostridia bacterium]
MKKAILVLLMAAVLLALTGCSCKHEETTLTHAVAATCTQEGYTGDKVCVKCNETVEKGEAIPAAGHTPAEPVNALEAWCDRDGYTGDVYCTVCNELLTQGEAIPMLGHAEDGVQPAVAATCEEDGREESVMCSRCLLVTQPGAAIPALGHQWTGDDEGLEATCLKDGYTAERTCALCQKTEPRQTIEKLQEHPYDDKGICTSCGWMKPGLYVNDEIVMSWEDMEKNGYAVVEAGKLIEIQGNMQMGKLVVGEDVTYLHGILHKGINNDTLKEVWLPRSVTELQGYVLYKNTSVTDVRLFCQLESLQMTFQKAHALERVVLPQSLRSLNNDCFSDTPALKEVNLPEGLEYIGSQCFYRSGVETLTLPETLVRIDNSAFWESALKELTLPASLARLGDGVFASCQQLVKVDMSACQLLTDMSLCYSSFSELPALTQVLLPPNLEKLPAFRQMMRNATALKHIAFPEGFTSLSEGEFSGTPLESVVWPVSLIEAKGLTNCDLKEIFYRGSEAQWKMTTASTLFPNAQVTFNYTGE